MLLNWQASQHHKVTVGGCLYLGSAMYKLSAHTPWRNILWSFRLYFLTSLYPGSHSGKRGCACTWYIICSDAASLPGCCDGWGIASAIQFLFFLYGMETASLWLLPCSIGKVCNRIHNASIRKSIANMENSCSVNSTHVIELSSKVTGSILEGHFLFASVGSCFLELQ